MLAFLFYDRQTGQIVHRHRQDTGLEPEERTKERVFSLIDPSLDRDRLDVVAVEAEEMMPGVSYQINPKTQKLEEAP